MLSKILSVTLLMAIGAHSAAEDAWKEDAGGWVEASSKEDWGLQIPKPSTKVISMDLIIDPSATDLDGICVQATVPSFVPTDMLTTGIIPSSAVSSGCRFWRFLFWLDHNIRQLCLYLKLTHARTCVCSPSRGARSLALTVW